MSSPEQAARRLGYGFVALAAATFGLIVLGARVRAHGAGLSCPDWPLCFGRLVPEFNLQIAFEWSHRLIAGSVSLGLAGLTALLWGRKELRGGVARALLGAWVLLGVQVVLGGLTVILLLAPWTVTAHLLTGTSFCALLVWISRDLLEWGDAPARQAPARALLVWSGLTTAALVLQIGLGGVVSSQAAGLACASFPTCDGESYLPTLQGLVGIHVLHRLNGFLLLACAAGLWWTSRRAGRVGTLSWTVLRLLIFQVGVGILNVLMRLPVELTGLHTALAAAVALGVALLIREITYAFAAGGR
jgi:cytochrome c oxidase assembly protein subunit 15